MVSFLHPCFDVIPRKEGVKRVYEWDRSYFNEDVQQLRWGPFPGHFTHFHRPLSTYWRQFADAGLKCIDFEEPRLFAKLCGYEVPVSVVFHLQK